MRPIPRWSAPLLLLLLLLPGCGARRGVAVQPEARTTVRVENRNFLDMSVFVLNGSQRVRLGTVPGLTTRVLPIPASLVFGITNLRFQVDPVGGSQAPISQEIAVTAGDEVELLIPS